MVGLDIGRLDCC